VTLRITPCTIRAAKRFVAVHHRHHAPPQGALFAVGVARDGVLVGVATVGRPVARGLQDGVTCEATRLCVQEDNPNACSVLYGAAARAAKALGYWRIVTYTLASEPGTSLRAAGWQRVHTTRGGSWDCPSRPRRDKAPTEPKVLWECRLAPEAFSTPTP